MAIHQKFIATANNGPCKCKPELKEMECPNGNVITQMEQKDDEIVKWKVIREWERERA
jgi:hypothetical protein